MTTRSPEQVFLDRLKTLIPEGEGKVYAKRAGISEQTLSKWRRGKIPANPKLETLRRLAAVLQKPVAYLVADEPFSAEERAEAGAGFSAEEAKTIEEIGRSLVDAGQTIGRALSAFQRLKKRRRRAG